MLLATTEVLDYGEFRPLKPAGVAQMLGISPAQAKNSLRVLCQHGFIAFERPTPERPFATFRLPWSRVPAQLIKPPAAA